MDDDKSGKVTYTEFSGMCREELKLKAKDVPDAKLQAAWTALDEDDGGFITAGHAPPCQDLLLPACACCAYACGRVGAWACLH